MERSATLPLHSDIDAHAIHALIMLIWHSCFDGCAWRWRVATAQSSDAGDLHAARPMRARRSLQRWAAALFFDPVAFRFRPDGLRHLPRSAARLRAAQRRLPVQLGGKDMQQPGMRAVPSLKYLQAVPQFTEHYFESDDEGDDSIDNGPTGGLTWDGRVDRGRDQARIPLCRPLRWPTPTRPTRSRGCATAATPTSCARFSAMTIFDDTGAGLCRHRRGARGVSAGLSRRSIPTAANMTPFLPAAPR